MKCCQNKVHGHSCAIYWHQRQRDEVEKRVAFEKEVNAMVIRHDIEISKKNEDHTAAVMDVQHEWALAEDAWRWGPSPAGPWLRIRAALVDMRRSGNGLTDIQENIVLAAAAGGAR